MPDDVPELNITPPDHKGPAGRPKGGTDKEVRSFRRKAISRCGDIIELHIKKALEGDFKSAKLVLDLFVPPVKDLTVCLELPRLRNAQEAKDAMAEVLRAVSRGLLTPQEGNSVALLLKHYVDLDAATFEARLVELERRMGVTEQGPEEE